MESVLITGGTGMIGTELTKVLLKAGYSVSHLTRSPGKEPRNSVKPYYWDPEKKEIDDEALNHDHIVHLAGAPVDEHRWSDKQKKAIYDSRVLSARFLIEKLINAGKAPKTYITASGLGFYGAVTTDHIFTEEEKPGQDFLAKVCIDWENVASLLPETTRRVFVRTAVVLSPEGGALERFKLPSRLHLLSPLGHGKQIMTWIHIRDLVNFYKTAIQNSTISGPYNLVADEMPTNAEFTKTLMKVVNKKIILPHVPGWAMKLAFGDLAEVLLNGSRVSNEKAKKNGFTFEYPILESALRNCLL